MLAAIRREGLRTGALATAKKGGSTSSRIGQRHDDVASLPFQNQSVNYYNTLIEVAEDCPATRAEVPQTKGDKKTKPAIEYEMIANHPYKYTEEDLAFQTHAVLHDIPRAIWPKERQKFLGKGHPHLRVSALPKRYGWGIHNNAEGKTALIALESPMYKKLVSDPHTIKVKAFRSKSK